MVRNKLKNNGAKLVVLVDTHQQFTKIQFDSATFGNIEVKINLEGGNWGAIFD